MNILLSKEEYSQFRVHYCYFGEKGIELRLFIILHRIHRYSSNKSFSNQVVQLTGVTKSDSAHDVGNTIQQQEQQQQQQYLCYHQCTKCAIVFRCHEIELGSVSIEQCSKPFFYGKCNICNCGI